MFYSNIEYDPFGDTPTTDVVDCYANIVFRLLRL
jgi:hypothetical protein